jgi:uncharacterized protein YdeI (YjbR/CyaY-like superfamily)
VIVSAKYFESDADFRHWLEENHETANELLVGFYKVGFGKPSMTWSEAVDQALCFGWIDGVRKRVDDERYTIRFTPRRAGSNWSLVNVRKVEELARLGLMRPAGLAAFRNREEAKSGVYSFENQPQTLDEESEQIFQANEKAWTYFESQPPSYRRLAVFWVMSAKKEETRRKRLATLIDDSANRRRLEMMTKYQSKKS